MSRAFDSSGKVCAMGIYFNVEGLFGMGLLAHYPRWGTVE